MCNYGCLRILLKQYVPAVLIDPSVEASGVYGNPMTGERLAIRIRPEPTVMMTIAATMHELGHVHQPVQSVVDYVWRELGVPTPAIQESELDAWRWARKIFDRFGKQLPPEIVIINLISYRCSAIDIWNIIRPNL